jgi:putative transposase
LQLQNTIYWNQKDKPPAMNPRVKEDGTTVRRGVSKKVRARLASEHGLKREQVLKRVKHFTHGVIIGSRAFIDDWFQRNRAWFGGSSAEKRTTGARKISKDRPRLHNLRQLRGRE